LALFKWILAELSNFRSLKGLFRLGNPGNNSQFHEQNVWWRARIHVVWLAAAGFIPVQNKRHSFTCWIYRGFAV